MPPRLSPPPCYHSASLSQYPAPARTAYPKCHQTGLIPPSVPRQFGFPPLFLRYNRNTAYKPNLPRPTAVYTCREIPRARRLRALCCRPLWLLLYQAPRLRCRHAGFPSSAAAACSRRRRPAQRRILPCRNRVRLFLKAPPLPAQPFRKRRPKRLPPYQAAFQATF